MATSTDLNLIVKLKDEASSQLRKIQGEVNSFGKSTKTYFVNSANASKQFAVGVGTAGATASAAIGLIGNNVQNLQNKVKSFSTSQEDVSENMDRMFRIAKETRAPISDVASGFQRLQLTNTQLGKSYEDTERMLTIINKGLAVSGANTTEASSAMLQLSQAYASGRLQGDEFRSLSETFPLFMLQMSDSMGMTIGQLKEFGSEGKITRDIIEQTLSDMEASVNEKFEQMSVTIGQAGSLLHNSIIKAFIAIDEKTGIFNILTKELEKLSEVISSPEFINFVVNFVEQVQKNLPQITGLIVGGLTPALIAAGLAVGKLTLTLAPFMLAGLAVQKLMEHLDISFMDVFNTLKDAGVKSWDAITSAIDDFKKGSQPVVDWFLGFMKNDLMPTLKVLGEFFSDTWSRIEKSVTGATKSIQGIISHWVRGVGKIIEGFLSVLRGDWSKAWDSLVAIVTDIVPAIMMEVMSLVAKIIEGFVQLGIKLFEVGYNAVLGLVDGIIQAGPRAVEAAGQVVNNIIGAATSGLQIHSPSRVFMKIGSDTIEGMRIGIQQESAATAAEVARVAELLKTTMKDGTEGMAEDFVGSYEDAQTDINKVLIKLAEDHREKIGDITLELDKVTNKINEVKQSYNQFLQGEAGDFGSAIVDQEKKIQELEKELSQARGKEGSEDRVAQLQQQLERERQVLEDANSMFFSTEQEYRQRVEDLETAHQQTITDAQNATDIHGRAMLEARAQRLAEKIEFMKSRESTLAQDQARLAGGVAQARITANQGELQNFIDSMVVKANEAQTNLENELRILADKKDGLEQSLQDENKMYESQRAYVIQLQRQMRNSHFSMMNDQVAITRDAVNAQIELYNRLAEAARNASSAGAPISIAGRRENGGPVNAGGTYLVGERGPELFTPNINGRITSNKDLSFGGNLTIQINTMIGEEEFAQKMGDEIVRNLQLNYAI